MRRPDPLLVVVVAAQWSIALGVALTADGAGWVLGEPDAARASVTAARALVEGVLPAASGPLYPFLLTPLVAVTESTSTVASVVVPLTVALVSPLAAFCLLDAAGRTGGRPFAGLAAGVWLLGPLAAIPLFKDNYRPTYVDDVLPALYGLTVRPEYLAGVLSLAAAAFGLRALDGDRRAAGLAGVCAGIAALLLPVAAGVGVGLVLAFAVARAWRGLGVAAAGFAAPLAALLAWRAAALDRALVSLGDPSPHAFGDTMASFREYSWSNRLLQWLAVGGAIGAARLRLHAAALLAGWFGTYTVVVLATATSFERGRVLVTLSAAWPAYALLIAAIPALVPTLARRVAPERRGARLTA